MKFIDVPGRVLSKYFIFEGRATRSEYWWWFLITFVTVFVLGLIVPGLSIIAMMFLGIPTVALNARRLHDLNRSGWLQLIGLIPFVGWVLLPIILIPEGTHGPNKYGPDPLEGQNNEQIPPAVARKSNRQTNQGAVGNPAIGMPSTPTKIPTGDQWIDATKTVVDATVLVESAGGAGTAFHMGDGVFFSAAHVVAGRTSVRLRNHLIDTEATVVKIHQIADVAQLQADRGLKGLGSLSWGLADNVREGQEVRIAGYPLDVEHKSSVTAGIISKILIEPDGRYFITDAAVNQGNSGGPLFTQNGQIIGIVTSKKIGIAVEGVAMATAENAAKQALESEGLSPTYLAAESILSRNATIRLAMYAAARDGNLTTEKAKIIKDWASSNLPPGTGVSEKERLNEVIKKAFADAVAGKLRLEEITHQLQVEGSQEDRDEAIRLVAELITGSANGTAQDGLLTTITELLK
jgi:uncharacterized membrane protein YhaH (DUF805 family)